MHSLTCREAVQTCRDFSLCVRLDRLSKARRATGLCKVTSLRIAVWVAARCAVTFLNAQLPARQPARQLGQLGASVPPFALRITHTAAMDGEYDDGAQGPANPVVRRLAGVDGALAAPKAQTKSPWLGAWDDPVAGVSAYSPCIHTCNLYGDGDWRLVLADSDRKLKVRVQSSPLQGLLELFAAALPSICAS